MAAIDWLLIEQREHYLAVPLTSKAAEPLRLLRPSGNNLQSFAQEIVEALRAAQGSVGRVVLALHTSSVMAATLPHEGGAMVRNHQSMCYLLEEYLPLAAEDFVGDFIALDRHALGVAIDPGQLSSLAAGFQDCGVPLFSITPWALLSLMFLVRKHGKQIPRFVVWHDGQQGADFFEVIKGRPLSWSHVTDTGLALRRELMLRHPKPSDLVLLVGSGDASPIAAELLAPLTLTTLTIDREEAAVATARRITQGEAPWIELRRGSLGTFDPYRSIRGYARMAWASCAALLLAVIICLNLVAEKYHRVGEQQQAETRKLYQATFPNERVRVGMLTRFESEHKKLAGVTGQVADVPQLESALTLLHNTLLALPQDLRYRITEIRVENSEVFLNGELRAHGDADRIASQLRLHGFAPEAPNIESLATEGVSFSMAVPYEPGTVAATGGEPKR